MIDKRKPFKTCPACQKRKPKEQFNERRVVNKAGEEVLYSNSYCIPCQRGNVMSYYRPKKKAKRRCHSCYKHKKLKDFARTKRHGVLTYHGNCKHCEETRDLDLTRYHEGSRREHDTINNRHYIAFIGKASFKEVCKVFKIIYKP
jgi:hypothetical protein